jgi:flagellar biosynthetic protein FlhB
MSDEDRIHPATPARQQQAWRDGDYAKSHELAASLHLLGGLLVAGGLFGTIANWLQKTTLTIYSTPSNFILKTDDVVGQLQSILYSCLPILGSTGALIVLLSIAAHWCQTGVVLTGNRISPDMYRLSPAHWFSQVFSRTGVITTLIGVAKVLLILTVMFASCWINRDSFLCLGTLPIDQLGSAILKLALLICGQLALVLLIGSGFDYWIKYLRYQSRIQMTDQQLREEQKMQSRKTPQKPKTR